MKCRYCGAEIGNSLECHLCGHKQMGKITCPVCSKLIYPYQEYCSNCGSPTIYRKTETIKKVTPDTSIHSETSHNYNTVSESYDYKKNAYDYKKPLKEVKKYIPIQKNKNLYNSPDMRERKSFIKSIIGIIVSVCFIFIPIVEIIIGALNDDGIETNDTAPFDDHGNSKLSSIQLQQDTSRSDYNYNFINEDGGAFIYHNELYVSLENELVKYSASFEKKEVIEDENCGDLYVDERGCFYRRYDEFIYLNTNGEKKSLLEGVDRCYVDGQNIFYTKEDRLYCLTVDQNMNTVDDYKVNKNVMDFYIDNVNQWILYNDDDYNMHLIDYHGNVIKKKMDQYDGCYFSNGLLYYQDYDGIYSINLQSNEKNKLQTMDNIHCFGIANDQVNQQKINYVVDYDGLLEAYINDDVYHIYDDASDFFIAGDKVIFFTYDDDDNQHYFISTYDGMYAPLQE